MYYFIVKFRDKVTNKVVQIAEVSAKTYADAAYEARERYPELNNCSITVRHEV